MEVLDFLLVIISGVGLSHIIADSSIASSFKYWIMYKADAEGKAKKRFGKTRLEWPVDKFVEMMNCHQCNGFWSGMIVFSLYWIGWYLLLWGFAISLLSPLWAAIYVALLNFTSYEEEKGSKDEK